MAERFSGNDLFEADSAPPPTSTASNENNAPNVGEIAVSHTTPPTSPEDPHVVNPPGPEEAAKQEQQKTGRPHVIVRIRPSPSMEDNIFEVDSETKTIQIRVDRDLKSGDPRSNSFQQNHSYIYFPADNVLENSSQEDTFKVVAQDVVEKAMQGTPGIVVAVGPAGAGKSFSLFGLSGRYRNRGIAARAMEKLFEIKERKAAETDFRFGLGIIEVRRERIRDLLTLSPYEINDVGDQGPRGMYVEEIDCLEHGLGVLLRALIGQKLIHKEPCELYHTIMYLEIVGLSPMASELVQYRSRITLAEIASAPQRPDSSIPLEPAFNPDQYPIYPGCNLPPKPEVTKPKSKTSSLPCRKCANPGYATGPLAESIAVRRDVFALEQIFLKAHEMHRIRKYFSKLEELGLSMIASERRKLSNSHNFRQSRLAHCLKDILEGGTEIRILLHVRPNKSNLRASLEAMRFAERARLVPCSSDGDTIKGKKNRTDEQILQEVITDIAPELIHPSNVETLNSEKMKVIQEQAVQYFENNIDSMKICSKDKVKHMFENFRVLWNFLWELELNVSLRKAEEEMRNNFGNQALAGQTRRSSQFGKDAGAFGLEEDEKNALHSKEGLQGKKSARKLKRDKEKKKKKEKQGKKDSQEFKPVNPSDPNTQIEPAPPLDDPNAPVKSPEEEEEEGIMEPSLIPTESQIHTSQTSIKEPKEPEPEQTSGTGVKTSVDQTNQPVGDASSQHSAKGSTVKPPGPEQNEEKRPSLTKGADVKAPDPVPPDTMTEEERSALAAKQEQAISNQFEEMKKVARRQAIHLLRAGVRRPQWMSLF